MIEPEKMPASRTVSDDFKCIINTYFSKSKLSNAIVNPEDNTSCPLNELGLVEYVSTSSGARIYKKSAPVAESLPEIIALAMIIDFANGRKEIRISALQKEVNSIGKICNLDTIMLLNILYKLESYGYIKVIRTAGLDVITILTEMDFLQCIKKYYEDLN